jgi:hypothetical protein
MPFTAQDVAKQPLGLCARPLKGLSPLRGFNPIYVVGSKLIITAYSTIRLHSSLLVAL